jgi:hypothetical protein
VNIRIRIVHDLDLDTQSKALMIDPSARPTTQAVRRAITATLADLGGTGALRQYRGQRHAAVTAGELDEHRHALSECRELLMRCYPPRQPRARRPAPQPQGHRLIDVVFDEHHA